MLRRAGADVHAVLTPNAREFVTQLSLTTITRNPSHCEQFQAQADWKPEHIELAKKADLILVAPATADIIAKMAAGMCDDLLTTMILASDAKIMLAPAMNPKMLDHPATQNNLQTLQNHYRYDLIASDYGELACGDFGTGKMALWKQSLQQPRPDYWSTEHWLEKRVIVTAGGTREPIDPVRFIGNRSSGKMGLLWLMQLMRAVPKLRWYRQWKLIAPIRF